MRWTVLGGLATTLLLVQVGIAPGSELAPTPDVGLPADAVPGTYLPEPAEIARPAEVARIRAHLSRAAHAIRTTTPAHLAETRREARRTTLEWLDEYRANGSFPHNHVLRGERTPVFVDPHGTPCAVGYLMLRSGEDELVEEIVQTDNLVRVTELQDDPRVERWLDSRGITLEEAAMIQPAYGDPVAGPRITEVSSYGPATVSLSLVTGAVATYAAMAGPDGGAPLVEALLVGTTVGHSYLLMETRESAPDTDWATAVNVAGLFVSVGMGAVRVLGRGDASDSVDSSVSAHVTPGPFGTRVGLTLRH